MPGGFLPVLTLSILSGLSAVASAANLSQAVVRQKVNVVTVAPSLNAQARPAAQGTVVRNENVVRTGNESRAELEFTDLTLARMGSNSIFSFDAQARALDFTQGAILFSKPTNSGAIELRSGAITAAITGSTGFISNVPIGGIKAAHTPAATHGRTTMVGMLAGKLIGQAHWRDRSGNEHSTHIKAGPGDLIICMPFQPPIKTQFDPVRFYQTSPLTNGSWGPLEASAQAELQRALADYREDVRRGFVQATNVTVTSHPIQLAWSGVNANRNSYDVSVAELGAPRATNNNNGGFINVGGTGIIRGQLVWDTSADLDLHLILPDKQQVYYANRTVTFNDGRATAMLDHDNLGGVIDAPPNHRVENIAITGVPASGTYTFFANSFSTPNLSDPFTLTVRYRGNTQVISGTLGPEQNSQNVIVQVPPGG